MQACQQVEGRKRHGEGPVFHLSEPAGQQDVHQKVDASEMVLIKMTNPPLRLQERIWCLFSVVIIRIQKQPAFFGKLKCLLFFRRADAAGAVFHRDRNPYSRASRHIRGGGIVPASGTRRAFCRGAAFRASILRLSKGKRRAVFIAQTCLWL